MSTYRLRIGERGRELRFMMILTLCLGFIEQVTLHLQRQSPLQHLLLTLHLRTQLPHPPHLKHHLLQVRVGSNNADNMDSGFLHLLCFCMQVRSLHGMQPTESLHDGLFHVKNQLTLSSTNAWISAGTAATTCQFQFTMHSLWWCDCSPTWPLHLESQSPCA